ncbi:HPr family phosphocarrier protein [Loktanella salsilacus]|jgi:phosphocarrier protein|uniref:Phosphocarrier protein n=1 Tax=Loktanella salsilacus TaxID=195913 RepID=A0A1I4HGW1_9RHOB|nr:HPr family phosphocarrier protein [Loktanella salsilacus]MBU0779229.1 HPr family phosphocarrier protein [Alphaproteobacteria bacterium]MBU0860602.1 HPr family phosphocarrier protein [Alphaproteobacteria bacterium]MBU1835156.1 HPr family phosphocarrier protein [Alphaproteobacteria bacterium]UTH44660.1 HPr family phosphocarrier protein [Loktanella salsilacus]UTH48385.1 HPr family phosphocarrier protein [Loktanella salsilacus]|tara:strand:+ start:2576 stop:2845 length:270 start_codon:yes stop_codon:yes gene_type:complete
MAQTRLKIQNVKGLHARASAKLVEVVEAHDATATVSKDGMQTGGDSIMGLLMLAATVGSWIDVETSGPDAQALSDAITALVDDKFGEGG